MRSEIKQILFVWIWRVMGLSIVIPIVGELINNLKQSSGILDVLISLVLSCLLGLFAVFAGAFTDEWGSPGQTSLMYGIYSWCSYLFYLVLLFAIFIGMRAGEVDE